MKIHESSKASKDSGAVSQAASYPLAASRGARCARPAAPSPPGISRCLSSLSKAAAYPRCLPAPQANHSLPACGQHIFEGAQGNALAPAEPARWGGSLLPSLVPLPQALAPHSFYTLPYLGLYRSYSLYIRDIISHARVARPRFLPPRKVWGPPAGVKIDARGATDNYTIN